MDLPYEVWLDSYNNIISVEHVLKNATLEFWVKNFSPHHHGQSGHSQPPTLLFPKGFLRCKDGLNVQSAFICQRTTSKELASLHILIPSQALQLVCWVYT